MDRHVAALLAMTEMGSIALSTQRLGIGPCYRHDKEGKDSNPGTGFDQHSREPRFGDFAG
jgi:hypothetical protein